MFLLIALNNGGTPFLVISRPEFNAMYIQSPFGSLTQGGILSLYLSYAGAKVMCSGQDFSHYLNNWDAWPYVPHDG